MLIGKLNVTERAMVVNGVKTKGVSVCTMDGKKQTVLYLTDDGDIVTATGAKEIGDSSYIANRTEVVKIEDEKKIEKPSKVFHVTFNGNGSCEVSAVGRDDIAPVNIGIVASTGEIDFVKPGFAIKKNNTNGHPMKVCIFQEHGVMVSNSESSLMDSISIWDDASKGICLAIVGDEICNVTSHMDHQTTIKEIHLPRAVGKASLGNHLTIEALMGTEPRVTEELSLCWSYGIIVSATDDRLRTSCIKFHYGNKTKVFIVKDDVISEVIASHFLNIIEAEETPMNDLEVTKFIDNVYRLDFVGCESVMVVLNKPTGEIVSYQAEYAFEQPQTKEIQWHVPKEIQWHVPKELDPITEHIAKWCLGNCKG